MKRAALLIALAAPALTACGLQPLYGGPQGAGARAVLGNVDVAPIQGQSGWLVTQALRDRLNAAGNLAALQEMNEAVDRYHQSRDAAEQGKFDERTTDEMTSRRTSWSIGFAPPSSRMRSV